MAEEAYHSVKKAGFKNIIILLSDVTKKYHEWALSKNEKIEIAKEKKIDYFFCYEWDCMIGEDYWFDKIWHECLSWDEPTLVGSPVLKLPHKANHDFFL